MCVLCACAALSSSPWPSCVSRDTAQVTVVGAAGGIGQPMSLLLKLSGKIGDLALFDIVNTPGVAADISHCNTKGNVSQPCFTTTAVLLCIHNIVGVNIRCRP